MTKMVSMGTPIFSDVRMKLSFLLLPIFFYSLVGLLLGILYAILQLLTARGGKSAVLASMPPYFPLFIVWNLTLLGCGILGWERNNLQIGRSNGPTYLAAIIGLSFLPSYLSLILGTFLWKKNLFRIPGLLVIGLPFLLSGYYLIPEREVTFTSLFEGERVVQPVDGREPTNVLLVTIDTLRRDHLGCYGNMEIETPAIDKLAVEGVLFQNCVAQAPITLPSHSSILTGTYPTYHGVHDNGIYRLKDDAISIAEILKEKGYVTTAFVSAFPLDSNFGLDQGFDLYYDRLMDRNAFYFSRVADSYALTDLMISTGFYSPVVIAERKAAETTDHIIQWLDGVGDKPFFLWVHLFDPHNPLNPPPSFEDIYVSGELLDLIGSEEKRNKIRSIRDFTGYEIDSPEVSYMKALYKAEVTYTDHHVGRIINRLDSLGLSGRTLVVFTADHGQSLFEHDYIGHSGALYAQTVNVPLIMRYSGHLPAGIKVPGLAQGVDIVPTILELLGLSAIAEVQGNSLWNLIYPGEETASGSNAYFETLHSTKPGERFRGLIAGEWKLIRSDDGSVKKLYHVADDPEELVDLSTVETERVSVMEDLLYELMDETGASVEGERIPIDSGTREILRSLGYVW
jgi:arylsulfatase A-like enzyme